MRTSSGEGRADDSSGRVLNQSYSCGGSMFAETEMTLWHCYSDAVDHVVVCLYLEHRATQHGYFMSGFSVTALRLKGGYKSSGDVGTNRARIFENESS